MNSRLKIDFFLNEKGAAETYVTKIQCMVEKTPHPAVDASSLDNT
jgi:hypothetical protein